LLRRIRRGKPRTCKATGSGAVDSQVGLDDTAVSTHLDSEPGLDRSRAVLGVVDARSIASQLGGGAGLARRGLFPSVPVRFAVGG
jgi:hypothetical protein